MQANISRRGATRQGWAKIKAEAEKGNLHRGEKEARKQQDPVGKEGLPLRYEKVDVTGQAWGGSGREESTNKRKDRLFPCFHPALGWLKIKRRAQCEKYKSICAKYLFTCSDCGIVVCLLFKIYVTRQPLKSHKPFLL